MDVLKLSEDKFQRLTGIKRNTYNKMLEVVTELHLESRKKSGVKSKFSIEQMLLITID